MNFIFSENYKAKQESITKIISNFNNSGEIFGDGDRNTIKLFQEGDLLINVKSFKIPHLINKIAYRFFRDSKAKRSFTYAQRLLKMGILTPDPIAYFEEKSSFTFLKSYYISKHQDYDLTFRDLIENKNFKTNCDVLRSFTRFTFDLHEKGVLFKDHSPGNTLIKINDNHCDFYLVDLNRMEFRELDFKTRINNFARLTPIKDMVEVMANEYAKLMGENETKVFNEMWRVTEAFQKKYHDKIALKRKIFFWKNKYKTE